MRRERTVLVLRDFAGSRTHSDRTPQPTLHRAEPKADWPRPRLGVPVCPRGPAFLRGCSRNFLICFSPHPRSHGLNKLRAVELRAHWVLPLSRVPTGTSLLPGAAGGSEDPCMGRRTCSPRWWQGGPWRGLGQSGLAALLSTKVIAVDNWLQGRKASGDSDPRGSFSGSHVWLDASKRKRLLPEALGSRCYSVLTETVTCSSHPAKE